MSVEQGCVKEKSLWCASATFFQSASHFAIPRNNARSVTDGEAAGVC